MRSRDNPDPTLILETSRKRKLGALLADPTNVAAMEPLVDRIDTLTRGLPKSIATASRDGQIARVIKNSHGENNDTPTTFNRRMDILFGEDCRNSQGRLPNILRGAAGMPLVVKYLQKIEWSEIEAELARPKLDRIIKELEFLSCGHFEIQNFDSDF